MISVPLQRMLGLTRKYTHEKIFEGPLVKNFNLR